VAGHNLFVTGVALRHLGGKQLNSATEMEYFDKWADGWLAADLIALIEPMRPEGEEIVNEAKKLGWSKAFDLFASRDVFLAFAAQHPSFLQVAKEMNYRHGMTDERLRATMSAAAS
jgi:hypothetical protein